ncbi:hypothetical protein FHS49_003782 [Sphingobium boeckii]|uniref:Uncharacterized protein n=1 Tax=Sphingobium boeckii TaxID=1082345 RepID=A0A7W9ALK5_9SPHN|nr:hypothetical protein [Sphingobium boeckii]
MGHLSEYGSYPYAALHHANAVIEHKKKLNTLAKHLEM